MTCAWIGRWYRIAFPKDDDFFGARVGRCVRERVLFHYMRMEGGRVMVFGWARESVAAIFFL